MRNMLYETAWKSDNGLITSGDAAMCKYFCANAAFEVVDSAMQVLGGVGIAGEHRIARFWRDLRVDRVSGGSDEMQILTLGRSVLKTIPLITERNGMAFTRGPTLLHRR